MIKFILLVCLTTLCSATISDADLFHDFVVKHKRSYFVNNDRHEFNRRFAIFKSNLRVIENQNAENKQVKLGITKFADMTVEEFRASHESAPIARAHKQMSVDGFGALPAQFSWVNKGVVGPVQEQGECGSTYEFTITESISSIYAINTSSSYVLLSQEELNKCDTNGCDGGDSSQVLDYVEAHGLAFKFTGQCPKGKVSSGVCITGASCSPSGNESALAVNLLYEGPMYITIDGSQQSFQLYTSGIYSDPKCSSTQLDISLLLVGYTPQAWICQNSWGTDWGMEGYIWIARNDHNMCGVATAACYPTGVAKC